MALLIFIASILILIVFVIGPMCGTATRKTWDWMSREQNRRYNKKQDKQGGDQ